MEIPVYIAAHLPRLRIAEDISFGNWRLWRMPFADWNNGTFGAFEDRAAQYDAAEPVFLNFPMTGDVDCRPADTYSGLIEAKSDDAFELLPVGLRNAAVIIHAFWRALSLAAPAALLPDPRLSQIFVQLEDGFALDVPQGAPNGLRVQGAADHEFVLQSTRASPIVTRAELETALELFSDVEAILSPPPEIDEAIRTLLESADPTLSDRERLALAAIGLEALLLPEIRSGLKKTFANRIAGLLGDEASAETLEQLGRAVYEERSGTVHGEWWGESFQSSATARAMLAAAIRTLLHEIKSGATLDQLRKRLDGGRIQQTPIVAPASLTRPAAHGPGLLAAQQSRPAVHFSPESLSTEQGIVMLWAPLPRLAIAETLRFAEIDGAPLLVPLSGPEILSLVDKDTRRDFAASLFSVPEQVAAIVWGFREDSDPAAAAAPAARLGRMRDFAVIALHLAGAPPFVDPELFGLAAFQGTYRLREPTIFQQSVLMRLRNPITSTLDPGFGEPLARAWRLVADYERGEPDPAVEYALGLFRRAFFGELFPAHAQATLLYACLEVMLGRFTGRKQSPSTEEKVARAAGKTAPDAVAWFVANGRRHRNAIAHGSITADREGSEIELVRAIVRAAMSSYLAERTPKDAQSQDVQESDPSRVPAG